MLADGMPRATTDDEGSETLKPLGMDREELRQYILKGD
jgi:hypothetical protein